MGLKASEFYDMTWEEYYYSYYGYMVRQCRYLEGIRVIYWAIYTANSDPKKGIKKPEQLMPLMTDKKDSGKITGKQKAEMLKKALDFKDYLNGLSKPKS